MKQKNIEQVRRWRPSYSLKALKSTRYPGVEAPRGALVFKVRGTLFAGENVAELRVNPRGRARFGQLVLLRLADDRLAIANQGYRVKGQRIGRIAQVVRVGA